MNVLDLPKQKQKELAAISGMSLLDWQKKIKASLKESYKVSKMLDEADKNNTGIVSEEQKLYEQRIASEVMPSKL